MSEDNSKLVSVFKKDGIIHCIYHTTDLVIDTEIMRTGIKRRIEICEGRPHPIFIDARGVKYWTLESRKYGFSKEAHECVRTYGVLINSSIIRTIVNWAIKVFPITIPRKFLQVKRKPCAGLRNLQIEKKNLLSHFLFFNCKDLINL